MVKLRSATLLCSIGMSLIIVISILGLSHLTANSNLSVDQNDVRKSLQSGNQSSESIEFLNHEMNKPIFGKETVKGKIKNVGVIKLRYTTINVNFYKNGNLIYSDSASLKDIAPGETKDFEITYRGPDSSPDSYDIALGALFVNK